ncbi:MAG: transporter [Deltaproteobacteria bacterium]|nr:transporter [Deltaproteobacteria bacterium]
METRSRLAHASMGAGLLVLLLVWPARCLAAQSALADGEESLTEKANDPTATLTQVQVKDEYTPAEYGTNAQLNTLILRGILAVRPHGPLNLEQIIRPTFQIETKPLGKGAGTRTGFGDTQLFDLFIMPWPDSRETRFRWGIGPYFVFPTASWHGAGQGAWQLGPAWAFAYHGLPHLVISALFQQATSFAYTSSKRSPVSSLTFQPLITYELPDDWYLAFNEATWTWNFRHNTSTSIPFSAGLGKLFRFSDAAALKTQLSGEWMLYRQFDPQEEQFTLKFEVTLLLPKLQV